MLTEYKYYQQEQAKHPDAVILLKSNLAYYILGEKANELAPILSKPLTHKHAGQCFTYSPSEYAYPSFSFGVHNLDKVLPLLIRQNYRVAIVDFDQAFRDSGGWEEMDKIMNDMKKKREEEERKKRQPVQLTLFDDFFN